MEAYARMHAREPKPLISRANFRERGSPTAISPCVYGVTGDDGRWRLDRLWQISFICAGAAVGAGRGGQISPSQPSETHGTKKLYIHPILFVSSFPFSTFDFFFLLWLFPTTYTPSFLFLLSIPLKPVSSSTSFLFDVVSPPSFAFAESTVDLFTLRRIAFYHIFLLCHPSFAASFESGFL